jgi:hypothetical protein
MENDLLFKELEHILDELCIEIKYGRGYFEGGICRLNDHKVLYLNRAKDRESHINIIISELRTLGVNRVHCSENIQKLLSKAE